MRWGSDTVGKCPIYIHLLNAACLRTGPTAVRRKGRGRGFDMYVGSRGQRARSVRRAELPLPHPAAGRIRLAHGVSKVSKRSHGTNNGGCIKGGMVGKRDASEMVPHAFVSLSPYTNDVTRKESAGHPQLARGLYFVVS